MENHRETGCNNICGPSKPRGQKEHDETLSRLLSFERFPVAGATGPGAGRKAKHPGHLGR